LVIGGGEEAEDKAHKLLAAGALVTLVAPTVTPALRSDAVRRRLSWFAREFVASDVQGVHLVMLTIQDETLAKQLVALRAHARFWLAALDQPAYSDVHLVSTVIRGPVQFGISTGGQAPLLARKLRQALEAALDARFTAFAHKIAELRTALRAEPKAARSARLAEALNGFAMEIRLSYPAEEGNGAGRTPSSGA
jgi:siroheme synthase-like protein